MDEFRALLKSRLTERGALARLSEASGISSHVIGRWRDGEGRPSDTNLKKLAPALGVPYEKLAKMCGYLPDDFEVAEHDLIETEIRNRTAEMREAVRDTPVKFWPAIIDAIFDRAIDGARDMAQLLAAATEDKAPSASADESSGQFGIDGPRRPQRPIKPREPAFA